MLHQIQHCDTHTFWCISATQDTHCVEAGVDPSWPVPAHHPDLTHTSAPSPAKHAARAVLARPVLISTCPSPTPLLPTCKTGSKGCTCYTPHGHYLPLTHTPAPSPAKQAVRVVLAWLFLASMFQPPRALTPDITHTHLQNRQ